MSRAHRIGQTRQVCFQTFFFVVLRLVLLGNVGDCAECRFALQTEGSIGTAPISETKILGEYLSIGYS